MNLIFLIQLDIQRYSLRRKEKQGKGRGRHYSHAHPFPTTLRFDFLVLCKLPLIIDNRNLETYKVCGTLVSYLALENVYYCCCFWSTGRSWYSGASVASDKVLCEHLRMKCLL